MKNKIGISALVSLAILNLLVVGNFSGTKAVFSSFVGLFFSLSWFYVFGKILEDKNSNEGDEHTGLKEHLFLVGPGLVYYLITWGIVVYVYS